MDSLPDFVKLADSFGAVGMRATKPGEVDDLIKAMLACDKAVIADVVVDQAENCYPMIPAGAAHNEIKLGPDEGIQSSPNEEGMILV
jgi:acetolactate synthase-1/2/3 large subunit